MIHYTDQITVLLFSMPCEIDHQRLSTNGRSMSKEPYDQIMKNNRILGKKMNKRNNICGMVTTWVSKNFFGIAKSLINI